MLAKIKEKKRRRIRRFVEFRRRGDWSKGPHGAGSEWINGLLTLWHWRTSSQWHSKPYMDQCPSLPGTEPTIASRLSVSGIAKVTIHLKDRLR
ncbi:hypothetical protein Pan216_07930 [Planctomycetes bacterium Pan216]|uniref:Uncharacterized protein n=1 Tax=Kolteria novifilia TaxID=2527975 RepID=A0A518AYZ6_9BACT|nr:hypothetical protein Pan216_07930 [Planctomycetes bacterium Pan216]